MELKKPMLYGAQHLWFLNISKAFYKVWHDGLIFRLLQNGICGERIKQQEGKSRFQGQCSSWAYICTCVAQGSILVFIYIYIYINDLSNDIKCKCKLFTNDKSLFSVVYIIDISENDLNHDLEEISEWNFQSKMNFNPNPTKQAQEIIFSRKNCFYSSSRLF